MVVLQSSRCNIGVLFLSSQNYYGFRPFSLNVELLTLNPSVITKVLPH